MRLSLPVRLVEAVAARLQKAARPHFWHQRRVLLLDGSTVSMPDTAENQSFFGQPSAQKPGCGFPVARLCLLFCAATGALVAAMIGPHVTSELSLWRPRRRLVRVAWGDATMFDFTGGAGIAAGTGGCIFVTDTAHNRIRAKAGNSLTFSPPSPPSQSH